MIELANRDRKAWVASKEMQLIVIDGAKVAADYKMTPNLKLVKARKTTAAKDIVAYKDGKRDSKKIDVRGKRLK